MNTIDYLRSLELPLCTLIALSRDIDPNSIAREDILSKNIYKTILQAINENKLSARKEFLKNNDINTNYEEWVLKPRDFVNFCMDNKIDISSDFLYYFNYDYWICEQPLTFDMVITILCLDFCPFPHEIIQDTIDDIRTSKLAVDLWTALENQELGKCPMLSYESTTITQSFLSPGSTMLNLRKVLHWYKNHRLGTNKQVLFDKLEYEENRIKHFEEFSLSFSEREEYIRLSSKTSMTVKEAICLLLEIDPSHIPRQCLDHYKGYMNYFISEIKAGNVKCNVSCDKDDIESAYISKTELDKIRSQLCFPDDIYWVKKEALTIDVAANLLYYLPQNNILFPHGTITDSIDREKVSEITQTLHSALKNEELGVWPSYALEPKDKLDKLRLMPSDKETSEEQIFIAPIKLLYWDILKEKKYPEIEKLLKRLIDDFHYKVEDGWFKLIIESDYNKKEFLAHVINKIILQRSDYFITDKSLYTKPWLSLHEVACLTLSINPDMKAPPYHLEDKYNFIIKEIIRDLNSKDFRARGEKGDLHKTLADISSCKKLFISNRKSFEQKFITMNPDFLNSDILNPEKAQLIFKGKTYIGRKLECEKIFVNMFNVNNIIPSKDEFLAEIKEKNTNIKEPALKTISDYIRAFKNDYKL